MHTIEADYLVVGAGAMAMAFIDALVSEARVRERLLSIATPVLMADEPALAAR
ncbi:hypothetical protein [Mycobacterium sp. 852002-10029_SCH5224772]|uniref:hypothetical protein n=1 Tax=Mycobacterium sp. 852002-10029_SCH5224772 TaxID=1834083 RepID=UPI000B14816B|nr:hypothetical protein [Mycobacterium sp. 852002-10029_SCH5224772]